MSIVAAQESLVRGNFNPYAKMDKDKQITLDITDEEVNCLIQKLIKKAYEMTIGIYPPMFHWLRRYGIYVLRF